MGPTTRFASLREWRVVGNYRCVPGPVIEPEEHCSQARMPSESVCVENIQMGIFCGGRRLSFSPARHNIRNRAASRQTRKIINAQVMPIHGSLRSAIRG